MDILFIYLIGFIGIMLIIKLTIGVCDFIGNYYVMKYQEEQAQEEENAKREKEKERLIIEKYLREHNITVDNTKDNVNKD